VTVHAQHSKQGDQLAARATFSVPIAGSSKTRLRRKAVRLDYREYDGMVHDWMLGPLPEGKQAINEIVETIRAQIYTDKHGL